MIHITETCISYHRGETYGESEIIAVLPAPGGRAAVVSASTPFHPVDAAWPDQPGDHGVIDVAGVALPVVDTEIVTVGPGDEIRIGPDVTARRGDPEYVFAVAHIVDHPPSEDWLGRTATLQVDTVRRSRLSAAHTGCHLVAYAFNEATDELWSKDAPRDSRGSRNFDAAALIDSRHHPGGSVDRYRLGKSLRRKGFDYATLLAELDTYVERANRTLREWVAAKAPVGISASSDLFTDRRVWRCEISPAATMPCGGTHVSSLGDLEHVMIATEQLPEEKELRLVASSEPR